MGDATTTALNAITSRSSRRLFVASAAAMPVALGAMLTASAQATPEASQQSGSSTQPFLMVTDREEPTLWFYSIPEGTLTGKLDNFLMASHGRAFQLPDGRLIVGKLGEQEVDVNGQSFDALILGEQGVPSIAASVPTTFGESAAWIAVDPNLTTLAFGSLRAGEARVVRC
jgi:hypothetical protein